VPRRRDRTTPEASVPIWCRTSRNDRGGAALRELALHTALVLHRRKATGTGDLAHPASPGAVGGGGPVGLHRASLSASRKSLYRREKLQVAGSGTSSSAISLDNSVPN
jgi:hypothetical protein